MYPATSERLEAAALVLVGVAVWSGSFAGTFQFDDFGAILGAGAAGGTVPSLAESATAIRPLTRLVLAGERRLFGLDPPGYHLLSVALHLASTLLIWRIGRSVTCRRAGESSAGAFAVALVFLVHPLATEAVTYLSGRASLLAATLSLLAVERWRCWRACGGGATAASATPWASIAAFALALAAKETAAAVPLALLLVDAAADPRPSGVELGRRLRDLLPHALVLATFLAAAAAHPVYRRLLVHSLALRPPLENLAVQPRVALEAVRLFVDPARLNLDHDLRAEAIRAGDPLALYGLLLALITLAALLALRDRRAGAAGWSWFLVHLVPTATLIARNDLLSERNLYLPMAGLCWTGVALAGGGLARLEGRRRRPALRAAAFALGLVLLATLATATIRRNALYSDPVELWRDTVRKSPHKARPHANLGWSLYVAGELEAAITEYRIAVRLEPDDAVSREGLQLAWERWKLRAATLPEGHVRAPGSRPGE